MRSFITTAVCLALVSSSVARVTAPHSYRDLQQQDQHKAKAHQEGNGMIRWFKSFFAQKAVEATTVDDTCYQDGYFDFVGSLPADFCQDYLKFPNQTAVVDYTPTSTYTTEYTTRVSTATSLTRVTPISTVTVTVRSGSTTDAAPAITARALSRLERKQVFEDFNRQYRRQDAGADNAQSTASMQSAFSSACSCQDFAVSTVTVTYTNDPVVQTLSAFDRTTTTVQTTRTAAARVVTKTTTEAASATSSSPPISSSQAVSSESSVNTPATGSTVLDTSSATTSSNGSPTPTAPAFTCPEDNNRTVSELVGNERFDYRVLCDTVLGDKDIGGTVFEFRSFEQCVGACSVANAAFDDPVCQGVTFFPNLQDSNANGNCFLKASGTQPNAAPGIDSAVLLLIAVAVDNSTATSTEAGPFNGASTTRDPSQINSMMSTMFSNSSSNMPMITPKPSLVLSGMMVQPPYTAYSTYVSDGTTYSTGTGFTTATTYANGSWFSSYYTSYSVAYEVSTAIYGATSDGYQIANASNTQTSQFSGENGGSNTTTITNSTSFYPGGYNVTEVITNQGYDANGVEVHSTDATSYFSYQTAGSSSGSVSSSEAGSPASASAVLSNTVFSTMIVSSGGTGGAFSTAFSGGPTPTAQSSATTIVNTYGTAYSSGYAISGVISGSGSGGEAGGVGSGSPGSTETSIVTIIVSSGGTQGASSGFAAGGPSGTPSFTLISSGVSSGGEQGASSGFGSGGPSSTPSPSFTLISSGVSSSGAQGASSGFGSGGPSGTGSAPTSPITVIINSSGTQGASSGFVSGGPAPTSPGSFSNSGGPRSPFPIPSSTGIETSPITVILSSGGTQGASSGFTYGGPSPTPPGSFSNTGGPRSPFPIPSSTGIETVSSNETSAAPTGTAPIFGTSGAYLAPDSPRSPYPSSGTLPGTAPLSSNSGYFSNTGAPRSSYPSSGTAPGTAPASEATPVNTTSIPLLTNTGGGYTGFIPTGTAPGSFSNTAPPRSPFPSSGTAPLETASASGPTPFNETSPASPSGTAPPHQPYGIYGPPPFVTAPPMTGTSPNTDVGPIMTGPPITVPTATCNNGTMGTTTMFVETTVYHCASTCVPPAWGGYGGGPQPFGPQVTRSDS